MGIVNDANVWVANAADSYLATVSTGVVGPLQSLMELVAALALMFLAVNHIFQFRSTPYAEYAQWAFRFIILYTLLSGWIYLEVIINLFWDTPQAYTAAVVQGLFGNIPAHTICSDEAHKGCDVFIDATNITNTATAADEYIASLMHIADTSFNRGISHVIEGTAFGIVTVILAGIILASVLVALLMAKLGFTIGMSFAPLALVMLMLPQTRSYFESWSKWVVGFAVIPMVLGSLLSLGMYAAVATMPQGGDDRSATGSAFIYSSFTDYYPYLLITVCVIALMFHVPSMVHALSGTAVNVAGVGAGMTAARLAMGAAKSPYNALGRIREAHNARKHSAGKGNGAWSNTKSAISGLMRNSQERKAKRLDRQRESGHSAGYRRERATSSDTKSNNSNTASTNKDTDNSATNNSQSDASSNSKNHGAQRRKDAARAAAARPKPSAAPTKSKK